MRVLSPHSWRANMCRICCMFSLFPFLSGYFFPRFPSNVPSSRPGFPRACGWCSIKTKLRAKHISQKRKVEEEQVRLLLWEGVWQIPGRIIPPWKVCPNAIDLASGITFQGHCQSPQEIGSLGGQLLSPGMPTINHCHYILT